jgi:DNA-directed RNA polymerase specialized sigma subunit
VTFTKDERGALGVVISRGKNKSQKILNVLILLEYGDSKFQKNRLTNKEIAMVLNVSMKKIDRVKSGALRRLMILLSNAGKAAA